MQFVVHIWLKASSKSTVDRLMEEVSRFIQDRLPQDLYQPSNWVVDQIDPLPESLDFFDVEEV